MAHGGYRKPSKPAAVSGPGSKSRRTDGGPKMMTLPDAEYGEQSAFRSAQQGAPMGAPAPAGMSGGGAAGPALVPLDAPTQRPDEPVTAGAALGPGVGPEALGLGQGVVREDVERLRKYLPTFIAQANSPNASQAFRRWVRDLRAELR